MAFCSNCGNQISDQAAFCNKCGTKQSQTPGAHMVLNVNKKEGVLSLSSCYLVFFSDRIVCSVLTKERQNQENKMLQEKIKSEGKGFFKGSAAMMSYWANYGNRYYTMNPDDILNESNNNTVIYNSQVNRIIFRSAERNQHMGNDNYTNTVGELIIEGPEKIKTTHKYGDSNKNIKRVLESLFGDRLKYKGTGLTIHIGGNKEGFM